MWNFKVIVFADLDFSFFFFFWEAFLEDIDAFIWLSFAFFLLFFLTFRHFSADGILMYSLFVDDL